MKLSNLLIQTFPPRSSRSYFRLLISKNKKNNKKIKSYIFFICLPGRILQVVKQSELKFSKS